MKYVSYSNELSLKDITKEEQAKKIPVADDRAPLFTGDNAFTDTQAVPRPGASIQENQSNIWIFNKPETIQDSTRSTEAQALQKQIAEVQDDN